MGVHYIIGVIAWVCMFSLVVIKVRLFCVHEEEAPPLAKMEKRDQVSE